MRSRRGVAISARASGCKGAGVEVCGRDGESGHFPGPLSASSRGRSRVAHPYPRGGPFAAGLAGGAGPQGASLGGPDEGLAPVEQGMSRKQCSRSLHPVWLGWRGESAQSGAPETSCLGGFLRSLRCLRQQGGQGWRSAFSVGALGLHTPPVLFCHT